MDAVLTIEMAPEHAVVIALALEGYIERYEFETVVAPHEVQDAQHDAVRIARFMRGNLGKMFYELAAAQLEHGRDEMPQELIEAFEQIIRREGEA